MGIADKVIATERLLVRHMREAREPNSLTDATKSRTDKPKSKAQRARERRFIDGMCEGLFRFTPTDHTPTGLWLRINMKIQNDIEQETEQEHVRLTDVGRVVSARPCIICETPTTDRSQPYNDPRCAEWLPCALRRNQARARPKPVSKVVAEAIELGHPVPPELWWAVRNLQRAATDD